MTDELTEYDLNRMSLDDSAPKPRCPLCDTEVGWEWEPGRGVQCPGCGATVHPRPFLVEDE
jgi:hypothetical protein